MGKKKRKYIVALTERYETAVWAMSRQDAIDSVDEHGGSSPVWHKVTARLAHPQENEPDDQSPDTKSNTIVWREPST